MRRGADTRGGEGVLSRIGFDELHQLLHRLGRNAGMHEQAVGRPRGLGDRREILVRVVGRLGVEARIDGVARRHEQDRVAVARRPGGGAHTEIAASPCHVLDVELWPYFSDSLSAMSRATTSVGPAAANGTMILTGRSGYPGLCENAATAKRDPVQAASIRAITLLTLMDVPWLLSGISIHVSFSRRRGGRWWRQARPRPRRHQPASQ